MVVEALNTMSAGIAVVGAWRAEDVAGYAKLILETVSLPREEIRKRVVSHHLLVWRDLSEVAVQLVLV